MYSGLVTLATLLVLVVAGTGRLDLLFAVAGFFLLFRAHGFAALDLIETKARPKSKAPSDFSLLVLTKRSPPAWNERIQPLIKSADIVIALDDASFLIPPAEVHATREPVTVGGRSFVLTSKFTTALPVVSDFGVPSGAALIATLEQPGKGQFQVGVVNLSPVRDPDTFSVARVTTRRMATQFRHSSLPAIIVGQFNSTAFGQPCRIFTKLNGLSHHVMPGLPTIFQAPARACIDPTNIIARGWDVEFSPIGAPGVLYAKLTRL